MPSGSLEREAVHADLIGTDLGPAGESGSVSLSLSAKGFGEIIRRLVSALHRRCGGHGVGVSRLDAGGDRTVAPAARLALRVRLGLCVGLSLRLLQTATLTKRRAGLAAPHLADPSS